MRLYFLFFLGFIGCCDGNSFLITILIPFDAAVGASYLILSLISKFCNSGPPVISSINMIIKIFKILKKIFSSISGGAVQVPAGIISKIQQNFSCLSLSNTTVTEHSHHITFFKLA